MAKVNAPICGLLLAGGESRRFGGDKLMAELSDGMPVAVATARRLAAGVDRVLAITRPGREPLAAALAEAGVEAVVHDGCRAGMGASIAAGVEAASGAAGWLIMPADMPHVAVATVTRIRDALRHGTLIARPRYRERPGHPVGFAAGLGHELRALTGDAGARGVIARHRGVLASIVVDDPGAVTDIDTPADLDRSTAGGE